MTASPDAGTTQQVPALTLVYLQKMGMYLVPVRSSQKKLEEYLLAISGRTVKLYVMGFEIECGRNIAE